jgi:hypothetical protein
MVGCVHLNMSHARDHCKGRSLRGDVTNSNVAPILKSARVTSEVENFPREGGSTPSGEVDPIR